MTLQRSRLRASLSGVSFLLLAVALSGLALLPWRVQPALPLDPHIPNEQKLIELGLSGTPGPGQPTRPVVVDRVLVDGVATYVQYHLTEPSAQGDPMPTLFDDRGVMVLGDVYSGVTATSGWTLPFALPSWMPWHPQTLRHGYVVLGPLSSTARAAVLQFGAPGGPGGPGAGETVRVLLNLSALARRRIAYPVTHVSVHGLTLTLQNLDFMHLTYACTWAGSGFAFPQGARLMDLTGHALQIQSTTTGTGCSSGPGTMSRSGYLIFPPQRPGTHLILTIPAFLLDKSPSFVQVSLHGPWRLSFVTP